METQFWVIYHLPMLNVSSPRARTCFNCSLKQTTFKVSSKSVFNQAVLVVVDPYSDRVPIDITSGHILTHDSQSNILHAQAEHDLWLQLQPSASHSGETPQQSGLSGVRGWGGVADGWEQWALELQTKVREDCIITEMVESAL